MQFLDLLPNSDDIIQINGDEGRCYQGKNGKRYKSVSYLAGFYEPKDFLEKWRKKVGVDEATRITNTAEINGTAIHASLEGHWTGEKVELSEFQQSIRDQYQPFVDKIISPLCLEHRIIWEATLDAEGNPNPSGKEVGFGGCIDAVNLLRGEDFIDNNGKYPFEGTSYILCDWKTKAKLPKQEYLIRYCLQLSAYSSGINKLYNCQYKVNKNLIIVGTPDHLQLFYLPPKSVLFYWKAFKRIIFSYYTRGYFDWASFKAETNTHLPQQIYLK